MRIKDTFVWLAFAIIYAIGVYFLGKPNTPAEVFLGATNLLFQLCLLSSIAWATLWLIIWLVFSLTKPALLEKGAPLAAFNFLSSPTHAKLLVLFIIFSGSLVAGAYLLSKSLTISDGRAELDAVKLGLGGVLFIAGLIKGGGYFEFNTK